jgi:hypothetical protein
MIQKTAADSLLVVKRFLSSEPWKERKKDYLFF